MPPEQTMNYLMESMTRWLQTVAVTFTETVALFIPASGDPLFSPLKGKIFDTEFHLLFMNIAWAVLIVWFAADALRLYIARDAGEQIQPPGVLVRRLILTGCLIGICGWTPKVLADTSGWLSKEVRAQIHTLYHPKDAISEPYPNLRAWLRNVGCWFTMPGMLHDGKYNDWATEVGGVPCVGVVVGKNETTMHWLPPDPTETLPAPDGVRTYNDLRDYWILRAPGTGIAEPPGETGVPKKNEVYAPVNGVTSFTDTGLTAGKTYTYYIGTWCQSCGKGVWVGPIKITTSVDYFLHTQVTSGRILFNIMIAMTLLTGVVVIVLQTAIRTVELAFAKIVGPIMILSAMSTDDPLSHGAVAVWFREVAVIALSQLTQTIVLCMLVEELPVKADALPNFGQAVIAMILIGIGTKGPRVLRQYAWSGDNGSLSGATSQIASRMIRLPW